MCKSTYRFHFLSCKSNVDLAISMKKLIQSTVITLLIIALSNLSFAQGMIEADKKLNFSGTADASMLQIAMLDIGGQSEMSTFRFSYFANIGAHANFNLGNKLTFYTGVGVKNLGFIYKGDSNTYKYRVYTAGVPVGLKIGNPKKRYFIIGGGVDFPINYKEKQWVHNREKKSKDSEWFDTRVNPVLPYVTTGYRFGNSMTFKLVYYPTNFWNDKYLANTANLIALTFGFDINSLIQGNSIEIGIPNIKKKKN